MNWYLQSGKESDVVLSTRIRLARNLKDVPFVGHMNKLRIPTEEVTCYEKFTKEFRIWIKIFKIKGYG